jgi:hypothetical protein
MCGIVGLRCKDQEISEMVLKELLINSQIRGKHATGIAYFEGKRIKSIITSIPAEKFIKKQIFPDSEYIIGHVRYSTSNLKYNQPLTDRISVVHNGVITQEQFENWEDHFGYSNFQTKNDTEILLKCLQAKKQPAGVLEDNKMYCFRNNTRPLHMFKSVIEIDGIPLFNGFASTEDIIKRTFKAFDSMFDVEIIPIEPFVKYIFMGNGSLSKISMKHDPNLFDQDQQTSTKIESNYVK